MATVSLDFVQPQDENIAALRIYESPTATGAFTQIERTEEIGTYPDYITRYSTALATNPGNWFAIAWEDNAGVVSELSSPVKGNADTLVAKVVDRVLLRDPSLSEGIAVQEAEAALEKFLGEDPYTTTKTLTRSELLGITYLALARSYIVVSALSSSADETYAAGIVSQKSGTSSESREKAILGLLKLAQAELGISATVIAQMAEIEVAGGAITSYDHTRFLLEVE